MKRKLLIVSSLLAAVFVVSSFVYNYFSSSYTKELERRLFADEYTSTAIPADQRAERAAFHERARDLPATDTNSMYSSEEMAQQVSKALVAIDPKTPRTKKRDSAEVKAELASLRSLSEDGQSLSVYRDHGGKILALSTRIPLFAGEPSKGTIKRLVSDHSALFGQGRHETISVERRSHDDEDSVQSFVVKRRFKDLPVWGNAIKVTGDRTVISGFNGSFADIPDELDISNKMTVDDFESVVISEKKKPVQSFQQDTLEEGIYLINNLPMHAYRASVTYSRIDRELVYVSPSSLKIISTESLVHNVSVQSRGIDLKGQQVDFFSDQDGQTFKLIDNESLGTISQFNWVGTEETPTFIPIVQSDDADSGWDPAAVSALANVETSLRYFKNTHNRSSFDNAGKAARSVINFINGENNGVGAWMHPDDIILYGTGGGIFNNFAIALDVAGHELTHGVINHSSGLEYKNQSGALNESFADIFGTMIERKNWTMGEDLSRNNSYDRYLAQPQIKGQPGHMDDFRKLDIDNDYGGVHTNSGIPNRAYFLLAQGLTDENKGQSVGLAKAEKLAYQTMIGLSRNDRFIHAAIKMIQVGESLYGTNSAEVAAVKAAWTEVGVYEEEIAEDTEDTVVEPEPVALANGDDVLFFLYPRDGDLEPSTVYEETYDIYGISVVADGQHVEDTLIGPFNDVPSDATVPFAYTGSNQSTLLIYRGTDGVVYFSDLTGETEDDPFEVDWEVNKMAISPDGSMLAVVPSNENLIIVANLETDEVVSYEARGPDYSEDQSLSTVDLVDAIDFDLASNRIVFDYRSCNRFGLEQGAECQPIWNIGILDLTTGFNYPFANLGADLELGNPKFSKIGRDAIVFDLIDYEKSESDGETVSVIITTDLVNRTVKYISHTTDDTTSPFLGAPSFVGEDQAISFNGNFDPDYTSIVRAKLNNDYDYDTEAEDGLVYFIPYEAAWGKPHRLAYLNIAADLSAWPNNSIYYGRFEKGPEKRGDIALRNTGNRKIEITDIEISEGIRTNVTNTTLLAGEEQSFQVYLSTQDLDVGRYTGELRIIHDGDNPTLVIGVSADLEAADSDSDGVSDQTDNCPTASNVTQLDTDSDGQGDACDIDDDGDGVPDTSDAFPLDTNETTDSDGDGVGDNADAFPNDSTETVDTDGDGIGDNSDARPNDGQVFAKQYLQTTSASQNITSLHILNTSEREQTFKGTLWGGDGTRQGSWSKPLSDAVPPMGRLTLSSTDLEDIFNLEPWQGPAMLRVQGESSFDLMSKLISPSGLVSNTNCVREDRVLNIEGFDSNNMSYVRLINTSGSDTGEITGTLYDFEGNVVGTPNSLLTSNLNPYQQVWVNRNDLANKVGVEWNGEALLEVNQITGLKLLNLNYITDEQTFFNFSCFEDSTSGRVYLQTTSTSQNVSATHLVNTSDVAQQLTGTLYGSDGSRVGSANQPLHSGTIPSKGRIVISSEDIESAFNISPWSGPAMLEVSGSNSFELMTKLTSPSGLISNTNCVRQGQVHNIGGFDQTDMTYVRFINIGDTPISNIRGSMYDPSGNVVGAVNPVLIDELPAKAQVWRNRNQLSDLIGDTWNGTASLKIDTADSNLRLLNLNYINSETFFNFSCYETGQ